MLPHYTRPFSVGSGCRGQHSIATKTTTLNSRKVTSVQHVNLPLRCRRFSLSQGKLRWSRGIVQNGWPSMPEFRRQNRCCPTYRTHVPWWMPRLIWVTKQFIEPLLTAFLQTWKQFNGVKQDADVRASEGANLYSKFSYFCHAVVATAYFLRQYVTHSEDKHVLFHERRWICVLVHLITRYRLCTQW